MRSVASRALAQIPAEQIETIEILIRPASAGATHETADHRFEGNLRFSFGDELTEQVRAAILQIPHDAWVPTLDPDDSEREKGEVVQITHLLDLSSWPQGSRALVRRERPHPGAQLRRLGGRVRQSLGPSTACSPGRLSVTGSSSSADSASLSNRASASSHEATAAAAS